MKYNTIIVIGLIIVGLLLAVLVPLATIWALNTLFGLGIAYSLKNIVAMLWLSIAIGSLSGYVHNR